MAFGKLPHSAGMFERFIFSGILSWLDAASIAAS